ncbi:MAG: bifunctional diguanylate cyclase/phosphodiesterase [Cyanobacteria bacterium J06621_3]
MTLPAAITHHLVDLATQHRRLAYLQVTPTGEILSLGGQIEAYGLAQAQIGDNVSTHLVYLNGFFPHPGGSEVIPHVHIEARASETDRTANVHFICDQDETWLLLLESTVEMQQQQQLQQKGNDLVLLQQSYARLLNQHHVQLGHEAAAPPSSHPPESHSQPPMENSLLDQIFSALKIMTLEVTADGTLTVISDLPDWLAQEFGELQTAEGHFEAETFSSFLSNFIIDAQTFWNESSDQLLRSGIWTETARSGRDITLEAIALSLEDKQQQRKIILVQSSELLVSEKFQWLQAAREAQLDIASKQKEAEEQLFHATYYDTLTDLPNRSLFTARLEACFEKSQWQTDIRFAVIVINIDRFQALNNSLGTAAGDHVLVTVAKRICDCLRQPDIPVRFGSDEFGILLAQIESEQAVINIVERLLESISQPLLIDGGKTQLTASAGIAFNEDWYQYSRDLLRDAMIALQQAKAVGRGRYRVFNREMRSQAFELWNLESALRTALERDELQLCYQPIVDLKTQRIERFEALARWQHPTHGSIPPSKFIPLAEESGLIVELDSWALRTACGTIRQWQQSKGQTAQFNVNISPQHFSEGNLLASIRSVVAAAEIPPSALCLEITESSLLTNPKAVITVLNQLKDLGVTIAIDDFGTGYASLSYLQDLPLDMLKIDGYFIKMMESSSTEIIQTIINLGHKLGLSITAEQVETVSQYKTLKQLGCDTVQGYLFSRPVPVLDAQSLMNAEVIISK